MIINFSNTYAESIREGYEIRKVVKEIYLFQYIKSNNKKILSESFNLEDKLFLKTFLKYTVHRRKIQNTL
jgi:hypothetical protein